MKRVIIAPRLNPGLTMAQILTRDAQRKAEASKMLRQASYSTARLLAAPRGVPMYASKAPGGGYTSSRGEVKFFDATVPLAAVGIPLISAPPVGAEPTSPFVGITELNCVQQGATAYNRIGTKILIKSIKFSAILSMGGSAPTSNAARVMLVYDRQTNGAFPSISAILSENVSTAPVFGSGVNMANRSRFVILRDQYFTTNINGTTIEPINWFIKTKLETQFSSNAGNIGDINTGAIYLVATSLTNSSVCSLQLYQVQSRLRYFD